MTKERFNMLVGSIGAFIGVFVFLAYIPQIIANLHGQPSQPWQPLFAAVSCLIWVLYGWTKSPKRDLYFNRTKPCRRCFRYTNILNIFLSVIRRK